MDDSYFRFVGVVSNDAKKVKSKSEAISFILSIKNPLDAKQKFQLPIIMRGEISHKAIYIAKKGNVL